MCKAVATPTVMTAGEWEFGLIRRLSEPLQGVFQSLVKAGPNAAAKGRDAADPRRA